MRLSEQAVGRLPVRLSARSYLTIQVRWRALCGSAGRAVAYLVLIRQGDVEESVVRLVRLPGSRLVELWSAQTDPWLTGGSR